MRGLLSQLSTYDIPLTASAKTQTSIRAAETGMTSKSDGYLRTGAFRSGSLALLETRAHGRDAPRVETEPVHSACVSRVLDLDAAVHDHCDAALLGFARRRLVDHAELAPQRAGTDVHGLPGDLRQRVRSAKDVHDVHGLGHVEQVAVGPLPQHFALARVDRDHPVAVAFEVEADEVAGAQFVAGQADDRDRAGRVQHALDG